MKLRYDLIGILALALSPVSHARPLKDQGKFSAGLLKSVKEKALAGEVIELIADNEDGTTEKFKAIKTAKGTFRVLGNLPEKGSKVSVKRPVYADGVMAIQGYDVLGTPDLDAPLFRAEQDNVLGVRLKFAGGPSTPCSHETVQDLLTGTSGSLTAYFNEMSRGNHAVSGTAYPDVIEVNGSATLCESLSLSNQAEAILASRGVNLDSYSKIMYFIPNNTCFWAGLAEGIPGRRSWLRGQYCGWGGVLAHELGHNIGLPHASSPVHEYGDNSDVMGTYGARVPIAGLNIVNKLRLGYMSADETIRGTADGQPITIGTISPPFKNAGTPKGVLYSDGDSSSTYYLSFRQPGGFDANISDYFYRTLSVHRGQQNYISQSVILATLAPGNSHTEPTGLRFTLDSLTTAEAVVRITKECVRRPPTIWLPHSITMRPGVTKEVVVDVTNNDSPACPGTTFSFQASSPAQELSVSAVPTSFKLSPQAATIVTLSLSTAATIELSYDINLSLLGHPSGTQQKTGSVSVDNTPPEAPSSLTAKVNGKCQSITLDWATIVSLQAAPGDKFHIYRNGAFLVEAFRIGYTDTKLRSGAYTYQVKAIDDAGNESAFSDPATGVIRGGSWQACEPIRMIEKK